MKLVECYVENFGKISGQKFTFGDGINCINADNGYGKTTLSVFIKVMLYGMTDTKRASLEENDRRHYMPWQGGTFGGTLTFSIGERIYRVERTFGQKASDDIFKLYDTALGKESFDFSENLGEELFLVDSDGFERTVFLSERQLSPKSDNKSISAKLSDLVGCDGDIGVMDDAMKILEERRKFYYKKGGSGELSELRDKIVETTKRLERLSQTELELGLSEKKLASVLAEFEKLRADSSALIKERDNATLREARADEQKRYEDLKRNLAEESAKRDEIAVSFGGVIPTFEQIDDAAYKHNEAKRLMENGAGDGSSEYRDLAAYFSVVENVDEIDGARRALDRVRSADARQKEEAALASEKFSRRIPEVCEIDEMITLLSEKRRISIGIPCGIVIVLAAVLLGVLVSPYLYLLGATGLPLLLIGVFRNRRLRNEYARRLSDFFASVTDAPISDKASATALLYEMRTLSERLSSSLDTQGEDMSILSCFAAKFGIVGDTLSGVESVLKKHERYVTLSVAEQYIRGERDAQRERAVRLMGEANAFLSHYNISRTEPFSELRRMLTEYNRLSEEIVSKQREINNYENRRFLSDDIAVSTRTAKEIDRVRKEMDERSSVLGRECALLERQCRAYADELEGRDEIIATLGALEEKYAKYKDNYEVILLTKKYLTDAKDSMTAKYLGKTKCGFEKYAQLIGNEVGEFEMDTSFGVSKLEGAGRKPTEAYSKGSRDLYDLSARLALTDALYDGELPFLVLDDPFSSFDDGKTAAALTLLSEFAKERQIIYFTCSKSRAI